MTKREFIKTSLGATAGLMTLPLAGLDPSNRRRPVADHHNAGLLSYFYGDDLIWLTTLSELPKSVIQNLYVNREYLTLGRSIEFSAEERRRILDESRALLRADENGTDRAHTQFALVAGGIVGEILDRELADVDYDPIAAGTHYLRVLHAYEGGPAPDQAINDVSEEEMAEALSLLRQRNLIRLHTFRPEWDDAERWVGEFLEMFHALEESDRQYARAYLSPPVGITDQLKPIYFAEDRPVRLARECRLGRITSAKPHEMAAMVMPESAYGRALHYGDLALGNLGDYVVGRAEAKMIADLL